jgi:hypothetical protein
MGQQIAVYPQRPRFLQTVTLDDVQYRLRLTWKERCGAWYADLYSLDGTALSLGMRVSPGWGLLTSILPTSGESPPGFIFVRGGDPYEREGLGESVQIVYYTRAEVGEPETTTLAVSVVP